MTGGWRRIARSVALATAVAWPQAAAGRPVLEDSQERAALVWTALAVEHPVALDEEGWPAQTGGVATPRAEAVTVAPRKAARVRLAGLAVARVRVVGSGTPTFHRVTGAARVAEAPAKLADGTWLLEQPPGEASDWLVSAREATQVVIEGVRPRTGDLIWEHAIGAVLRWIDEGGPVPPLPEVPEAEATAQALLADEEIAAALRRLPDSDPGLMAAVRAWRRAAAIQRLTGLRAPIRGAFGLELQPKTLTGGRALAVPGASGWQRVDGGVAHVLALRGPGVLWIEGRGIGGAGEIRVTSEGRRLAAGTLRAPVAGVAAGTGAEGQGGVASGTGAKGQGGAGSGTGANGQGGAGSGASAEGGAGGAGGGASGTGAEGQSGVASGTGAKGQGGAGSGASAEGGAGGAGGVASGTGAEGQGGVASGTGAKGQGGAGAEGGVSGGAGAGELAPGTGEGVVDRRGEGGRGGEDVDLGAAEAAGTGRGDVGLGARLATAIGAPVGAPAVVRVALAPGLHDYRVELVGPELALNLRSGRSNPRFAAALRGETVAAQVRRARRALRRSESSRVRLVSALLAAVEGRAVNSAGPADHCVTLALAQAELAGQADDLTDAERHEVAQTLARRAARAPAGALVWRARRLGLELAGQDARLARALGGAHPAEAPTDVIERLAEAIGGPAMALRSPAVALFELARRRAPLDATLRAAYRERWRSGTRWAALRADETAGAGWTWIEPRPAADEYVAGARALWRWPTGRPQVLRVAAAAEGRTGVLRVYADVPAEAGAVGVHVDERRWISPVMERVERWQIALPAGEHRVGMTAPAGATLWASRAPGDAPPDGHLLRMWPAGAGETVKFVLPGGEEPAFVRLELRALGAAVEAGARVWVARDDEEPRALDVRLPRVDPGVVPVQASEGVGARATVVVRVEAGTRTLAVRVEDGGPRVAMAASIRATREEAGAYSGGRGKLVRETGAAREAVGEDVEGKDEEDPGDVVEGAEDVADGTGAGGGGGVAGGTGGVAGGTGGGKGGAGAGGGGTGDVAAGARGGKRGSVAGGTGGKKGGVGGAAGARGGKQGGVSGGTGDVADGTGEGDLVEGTGEVGFGAAQVVGGGRGVLEQEDGPGLARLAALSRALRDRPDARELRLERAELLLDLDQPGYAYVDWQAVTAGGLPPALVGPAMALAERLDALDAPDTIDLAAHEAVVVAPALAAAIDGDVASLNAVEPAVAATRDKGPAAGLAALDRLGLDDARKPGPRDRAAAAAAVLRAALLDRQDEASAAARVWASVAADAGLWQAGLMGVHSWLAALDGPTARPGSLLRPRPGEPRADGAALAYGLALSVRRSVRTPAVQRLATVAATRSSWSRVASSERDAGVESLTVPRTPALPSPNAAVRQALVVPPWPHAEATLLRPGYATVLALRREASDLAVDVWCEEVRPGLGTREAEVRVTLDGVDLLKASVPAGAVVGPSAAGLPAGRHRVEVELAAASRGHLCSARLRDGAGTVGSVRPTTWRVARPGQPVEVVVLGPTTLAIEGRALLGASEGDRALQVSVGRERAKMQVRATMTLPERVDPLAQPEAGRTITPGVQTTSVVVIADRGPHRVVMATARGAALLRLQQRVDGEPVPVPRPPVRSLDLGAIVDDVGPIALPPATLPSVTARGRAAQRFGTTFAEVHVGSDDLDGADDLRQRLTSAVRVGWARALLPRRLWLTAAPELRPRADTPITGGGSLALQWYLPRAGLRGRAAGEVLGSRALGEGAWALRGSLRIDRPTWVSRRVQLLPSIEVGLRGQSVGPRGLAATEPIHPRIFTKYAATHPLALRPGLELRWQRWQDARLYAATDVVVNSDFKGLDQVNLRGGIVGVLAVLRAVVPEFAAEYEGSARLADTFRARTYVQHRVRAAIGLGVWAGKAARVVFGVSDSLFASQPFGVRNVLDVWLRVDAALGRGLRDYGPLDMAFRPVREPRLWLGGAEAP